LSGLGRLRWRCRRGMKELDVLLERWLDHHGVAATPQEQGCFESLLELQDPELARYLLAGEPHPDPEVRTLIGCIRQV
jgi:antitoxin CptB